MKITDEQVTALHVALATASLRIARENYAGPRWIADKQAIADSLTRTIVAPGVGALTDGALGYAWVVVIPADGSGSETIVRQVA